MSKLITFILCLVPGCIAIASTTQPTTQPTTAPTTRPAYAPTVRDRVSRPAPPAPGPRTVRYVQPGDLGKAITAESNIEYHLNPAESYTANSLVITASNVSIVGYGSTLNLTRKPGDNCDIEVRGQNFCLSKVTLKGDNALAVRVRGAGASFTDCLSSNVNSFLWIEPSAVHCTAARCGQLDQCGGQWIYSFADATQIIDPNVPFGSGKEEPIRFSAPDPLQSPGYLPPVDGLVDGGCVYQPSSPANLRKSAIAIRQGRVIVRNPHVTGAITAGQKTGADNVMLTVENVTFDPDGDNFYPNISTQSGVTLAANANRFRANLGQQPISLGAGSTLASADGNVVIAPQGYQKALISCEGGARLPGSNTVKILK